MRLENLMKKALVIICGKTRDIVKNESKIGLKHPMQFTKSMCNTNIIVMCAPLRFDLRPFSCVNKEVAVFNKKLLKLMTIFNHLQTWNISLNRIHSNAHGLHTNNLGKGLITNIWAGKIKDLFLATSSKPAISLPWKQDAGTSVMEENGYLAIVNSDCLSHDVTGIDQDIYNVVTNCNETTGVLDDNSNLHRYFISSDMNTINSPIQKCDSR